MILLITTDMDSMAKLTTTKTSEAVLACATGCTETFVESLTDVLPYLGTATGPRFTSADLVLLNRLTRPAEV